MKKQTRKITSYRGFTIMYFEGVGPYSKYYYIKEHNSLTFRSVDEAEDFIDKLMAS